MNRFFAPICGLVLLVALSACGLGASGETLVVRNGVLIDGTGAAPIPNAVVVIKDGLITAVGAESEVEIPGGATVVDADGGAILPGLIDTHTHNLTPLNIEDGEVTAIGARAYLIGPLEAGVTAFRDVGSSFGESRDLGELRAALDSRRYGVPAVVLTGPILAAPESIAVLRFSDQSMAVEDPQSSVEAVNRLLDEGVDQIKILLDTEMSNISTLPTPSLTEEQVQAIVTAAHERGVWVVAHVSTESEAWMAVDSGVDELTHWPGEEALSDDLIEQLVADDISVGTTFSIVFPHEGDVRRLLDAGGRIVLSSDAPGTMSPSRITGEMALMIRAGMTPMEVLLASTAHAADVLGLGAVLGTLEAGKQADLLVVAGDPLADIGALSEVVWVIKGGEVVFEFGAEE